MKKVVMLVVFLAVLVWSVSGYCQPSGQAGTGDSGSSVGDTGNASSAGQGTQSSDQTSSVGQGAQPSGQMGSAVESETTHASETVGQNAQQEREKSEGEVDQMEDQMASHSTSQREVDTIGR